MSVALVADVGHVARVTVDIVPHLLQAAVGQVVVIGAFGGVAVTVFIVTEVVTVVILDAVTVLVPRPVVLVGLVGLLEGRKGYN